MCFYLVMFTRILTLLSLFVLCCSLLLQAPQKREILGKSLASKLNLDELTLNLIAVLSENGRMKLFPAVARAFNKTMAVSRGEINVNVTTSSALDAESQKELNDVLQAFAKGKNAFVDLLF